MFRTPYRLYQEAVRTNTFGEAAGYKINTQISVVFPYTIMNDQKEK